MSGRLLRVELPLPPNLANGRFHWRTLARKKKEYNAQCDVRQQLGLIPPPPQTPFVRTVLRATMYVTRMHDDDNAVARCKMAVDWLRTRGYIVNDNREHLQWAGFPRQITQRGNPPSVQFTLTELAVLAGRAITEAP